MFHALQNATQDAFQQFQEFVKKIAVAEAVLALFILCYTTICDCASDMSPAQDKNAVWCLCSGTLEWLLASLDHGLQPNCTVCHI